MSEPKAPLDLLRETQALAERVVGEQNAVAKQRDRPPELGDVYVLEATREFAVSWVLVSRDPADEELFLAIPVDGFYLVGSADFALEEGASIGAQRLRCRFGVWVRVGELVAGERIGVVENDVVVRGRLKWIEVANRGEAGTVLEREVDEDPEYEDWVEEVLRPARGVLIGKTPVVPIFGEDKKEAPVARPAWWSQGSMLLRIAASVVVVVASAQLWRLSGRIQDLETSAKVTGEQHDAAVQQLETERAGLTAEQNRLRERLQELEATGADSQREARELRERLAVLDQRLIEAEKELLVVNPAIAIFSPPVEEERGTLTVTISPEQSYVVVFLRLVETSPAPWYQLKVSVKGDTTAIWTNDRLVLQKAGEILVGLPVKVLRRGKFELELLALEGDTVRRVAEYELILVLDTSKRR